MLMKQYRGYVLENINEVSLEKGNYFEAVRLWIKIIFHILKFLKKTVKVLFNLIRCLCKSFCDDEETMRHGLFEFARISMREHLVSK